MFEGLYNSPQKVGDLISIPEIPILLWNRDSPVTTQEITYQLVRIGSSSKDAIATPSTDNILYTLRSSSYYSKGVKFCLEAICKTNDAVNGYVCVGLVNTRTSEVLVELYSGTTDVDTWRSDKIDIGDLSFADYSTIPLGVGFYSLDVGDTASLYQARLIIFPPGSKYYNA
jgi:hypothetical protein